MAILCLDFDGVLHSYSSGWKGADVIPDPPVPGAMEFLDQAVKHFRVAIFSSRSNQEGGIQAMKDWLLGHLGLFYSKRDGLAEAVKAVTMVNECIDWPTAKPAAFLTIDDRCIPFDGTWPTMETLHEFRPWNKKGGT